MSAPGIQLKSETHLPLVQPTIRQYLQGIKEAVITNNLPAAQKAFAQLQKTTSTLAHSNVGQQNAVASPHFSGLAAIGTSLESGDLAGVEQALDKYFPALRSSQQDATVPESAQTSAPDVPSEDDGNTNSGKNLNAIV